jgi:protein SCO1/2
MKDAQIGSSANLAATTRMLRGKAGGIARIAQALGFHYIYDPKLDQYAHPAAVFTVTADGRVGHALSGLALDPQNLRLAIVEAGRGRVGTIADHVRLLCYGFDPTRGRYNFAVGRALSIGGGATLIFLVGFLGIMFRRERPAR